MDPYHVFVLKNLFQRFFGPHYPTEVIGLIVMILYKPVKIVAGYERTVLINDIDISYVWGNNSCGRLGLGDKKNRNFPSEFSLKDIKLISCGVNHTIAILESNKMYVWGVNGYGQLGLGDDIDRILPQEFTNLTQIKSISCGEDHIIALTVLNKVYIWGNNYFGQLGLGDRKGKNTPQELMLDNVASICCGLNHTIAMTYCHESPEHLRASSIHPFGGEIYVWGKNDDGRLGLGDYHNRYLPTKLSLANVKSIFCGGFHTIALTSNNKIYSWGENYFGQLGLGDRRNRNTPCLVDLNVNVNGVKSISCGKSHTIALTTSNKLYVWGRNDDGQLGLGDINSRYTPQELILANVNMISCGQFHTIATTYMNEIYVWGFDGNEIRYRPYLFKF